MPELRDLERLKKLCAETPKGPWGYYGNTVVGLTADCSCPEMPLLSLSDSDGAAAAQVVGPPHECHDIIPGLFEDDVASDTLSFEQYIAVLKFCAEARTALPALVEELEKVYAVMEKQGEIVLGGGIELSWEGPATDDWTVLRDGKIEDEQLSAREALHRAWELTKEQAAKE